MTQCMCVCVFLSTAHLQITSAVTKWHRPDNVYAVVQHGPQRRYRQLTEQHYSAFSFCKYILQFYKQKVLLCFYFEIAPRTESCILRLFEKESYEEVIIPQQSWIRGPDAADLHSVSLDSHTRTHVRTLPKPGQTHSVREQTSGVTKHHVPLPADTHPSPVTSNPDGRRLSSPSLLQGKHSVCACVCALQFVFVFLLIQHVFLLLLLL